MPTRQNFNYLQIKTAEQVNTLIEKCQDTLDQEYVMLFEARKVISQLISNQFTQEQSADEQEAPPRIQAQDTFFSGRPLSDLSSDDVDEFSSPDDDRAPRNRVI